MRRSVSVKLTIGLAVVLAIVCSVFVLAQQPAAQGEGRGGAGGARQGGGGGAAGGTGAARASAAPAFFKVEWVQPAGQTGQVAIVQGNVADPNLDLKWYGPAAKHLLTSGTPGSDTTPFSAWSGECDGPFAITFRQKNNYVDLTGLARIRWVTKTSGFHAVRPVVKLADGTMLVGDRADANVPMLIQNEFAVASVRWIKLDPARVVTVNNGPGGANNYIWVTNPDLSKVDEVGFADLMPSSGHGTGGYIHLGTIEVFGKPVPRGATN